MDKKEAAVNVALGTMSALSIDERWQYFKENALGGVQKVFDDSITVRQFGKLTTDDWEKFADVAAIEVEKIGKVFRHIAQKYDSFGFMFNTRNCDDWSNIYFDDDMTGKLEDEMNAFLHNDIYNALGFSEIVVQQIIMNGNADSKLPEHFSWNSDS